MCLNRFSQNDPMPQFNLCLICLPGVHIKTGTPTGMTLDIIHDNVLSFFFAPLMACKNKTKGQRLGGKKEATDK